MKRIHFSAIVASGVSICIASVILGLISAGPESVNVAGGLLVFVQVLAAGLVVCGVSGIGLKVDDILQMQIRAEEERDNEK